MIDIKRATDVREKNLGAGLLELLESLGVVIKKEHISQLVTYEVDETMVRRIPAGTFYTKRVRGMHYSDGEHHAMFLTSGSEKYVESPRTGLEADDREDRYEIKLQPGDYLWEYQYAHPGRWYNHLLVAG